MILIPSFLESFRSLKDKTYKLTFETSELTPEQLSGLAASLQHFGYLAFNKDEFKHKEIELLTNLKADFEDTGKTKAQRLRGVLYRWWELDKQGYEVFDDFYNHHMEKMITHFKTKLP
jgi:hypothetical protein